MIEVLLSATRRGEVDTGAGAHARRRRRRLHGRAMVAAVVAMVAGAAAPGATSPSFAADSCPNAAIRAQQHSEALPDCRAYELVSPPDKAGGAVAYPTGIAGFSAGQVSLAAANEAGSAVAFGSYQAFGGASSGLLNSYRSRRSASGWVTDAWSPRATLPHPELQNDVRVKMATEDFETGFFSTDQS